MLVFCRQFVERKISAEEFKVNFNRSFVDYANDRKEIPYNLNELRIKVNSFDEKLYAVSPDHISGFELREFVIETMKDLDNQNKLNEIIDADFRAIYLN